MTFGFEFLVLLRALVVELGPPVRSYLLCGRIDGLGILLSFYLRDKRGFTATGNVIRVPSQVPLAEAILSLVCACQPPSLGEGPVFEDADEEEMCVVLSYNIEKMLLRGINDDHIGQILDDMLFFERGNRITLAEAEADASRRKALLLRFLAHVSYCPELG